MTEFGENLDGVAYIPRPGSYAVIIEDERIATVRSRRLGGFFLVGGAIEAGETPLDALRREAREEIGYEIEIAGEIGVAREYFYAAREARHFAKECHFYRARLLEKTIGEAESALVWISADELGEMYHRSHEWIVRKELEKPLN